MSSSLTGPMGRPRKHPRNSVISSEDLTLAARATIHITPQGVKWARRRNGITIRSAAHFLAFRRGVRFVEHAGTYEYEGRRKAEEIFLPHPDDWEWANQIYDNLQKAIQQIHPNPTTLYDLRNTLLEAARRRKRGSR